MSVREPAVAGMFYPADAGTLRADVDEMLRDADEAANSGTERTGERAPVACIAPHAGHRYSGRCAAAAYVRLDADRIRRIVIAGPTHRVGIGALALSGDQAFATPLGEVEVDAQLEQIALEHPAVVVAPPVHAREHSLEVHLPFVQRRFPDATVLPIAVGDVTPEDVASLYASLLTDDDTALIVSSDLSHFETGAQAREHDADTIDRILQLDGPISGRDACGARPVNGLLTYAGAQQLRPNLIDYYHSGDTPWGDNERVVGYASVEFLRALPKHSDS